MKIEISKAEIFQDFTRENVVQSFVLYMKNDPHLLLYKGLTHIGLDLGVVVSWQIASLC